VTTHFPVYVRLWGVSAHPHIFFESLAYVLAVSTYLLLRKRFGDHLSVALRWTVVAAAVAGGAIGSRILFWFEDPRVAFRNLNNPEYLMGGKTIVGGLIAGTIAVELVKRFIGTRSSTGDLYAIPLALGIGVGRIGCFLTGLDDNTYGTRTNLIWGVDFGDGISRHPTQLYETAFLLGLIIPLWLLLSKTFAKGASEQTQIFIAGDTFKFFMVTYLTFRFFCDFIKPYPIVLAGLQGIQWACLLVLLYYSGNVARWFRRLRSS
jgi:phosphatidylglycerol:prolipoprotein diacylglycerol transferase